MNFKKEIKLPGLFRRRRERDQAEVQLTTETEHGNPETSASDAPEAKKRLRLFRRTPKPTKEPKEAKAPKEAKRRDKRRAGRRTDVPKVPLMQAFNLLPKETPRVQKRERPPTAQIALAVVALVLVAAMAAATMILRASTADKEAQRDELVDQVAALQESLLPGPTDDGDAVDAAAVAETNARTAAVANALNARVAWDRLLRELSLVTPEDVWLTAMTVTPPEIPPPPAAAEGESVPVLARPPQAPSPMTITGFAFEQEDVAQVLSRLALVPELTSVQLLSTSTVSVEETKLVQFSIAVGVKPSGGSGA